MSDRSRPSESRMVACRCSTFASRRYFFTLNLPGETLPDAPGRAHAFDRAQAARRYRCGRRTENCDEPEQKYFTMRDLSAWISL
jgi:hypothetical protein